MLMNEEKELILKYIHRNYNVRRIKHKSRFRRTIILDDGTHFLLGEKETQKRLLYSILEHLELIFYVEKNEVEMLVKDFLHM